MRAPVEIVARIRGLEADPAAEDFFGFRREVLLGALDFERARPWLKDDATPDGWAPYATHDQVRAAAVDYLGFAWEKAAGHRGVSANRSVEKLAEFAWLLGRDDVVEAMDRAPYPQYGVPKLVVFAAGLDLPVPPDEDLARMARGLPCRPGCDAGCGR